MEKLEELYLSGNEFSELPKDVFKPLSNLQFLSIGSNLIKVIHSDAFGIHNKLTEIDLTNNELVAVDGKIVDKTAVGWLDMSGNICSQEEVFDRDEIKEKIRKCNENYQ
jgi:Leucine-rich repeat (LRR) protein